MSVRNLLDLDLSGYLHIVDGVCVVDGEAAPNSAGFLFTGYDDVDGFYRILPTSYGAYFDIQNVNPARDYSILRIIAPPHVGSNEATLYLGKEPADIAGSEGIDFWCGGIVGVAGASNGIVQQRRGVGIKRDFVFIQTDGVHPDYQVVIKADGKFGIGSTTPAARFEVGTDSRAYADLMNLNVARMEYVSKSIDTNCHQGYTTDGTNHYLFDTGTIYKYDAAWTLIDTNSTVLTSLGLNHLGDGCYHDGKLYMVCEDYPARTGMSIGLFDAETLDFISKTALTDITEVSSCTVDVAGNFLYVSNFDNSELIGVYDLDTFAFIRNITVTPVPAVGAQGIYYKASESTIYLAAHATGTVGQMYRIDLDGSASVISNTYAEAGMEGFDYSQSEIRWLFDQGAGNKKVHYLTVDLGYPAVQVTEAGNLILGNTLAKFGGWERNASSGTLTTKSWTMGSDGTYVECDASGLGWRFKVADLFALYLGYGWDAIPYSLKVGGTTGPVASALVEFVSTAKGFLPPRMTTTQRDAIATPAEGLVIYNTTTHKLNVYTTVWEAVTSA